MCSAHMMPFCDTKPLASFHVSFEDVSMIGFVSNFTDADVILCACVNRLICSVTV